MVPAPETRAPVDGGQCCSMTNRESASRAGQKTPQTTGWSSWQQYGHLRPLKGPVMWLSPPTQKSVKNKDLWQALDSLCRFHKVRWEWTRGHAGHEENELADQLAREAISEGQAGGLKEDRTGRIIHK